MFSNIIIRLLTAICLLLLVSGCGKAFKLPFKDDIKAPKYEVVDTEFVPDEDIAHYIVELIVSPSLTNEEIKAVCRKVILTFTENHNSAIFFYYKEKADVGKEYTVAQVTWNSSEATMFSQNWMKGDYRDYQLSVNDRK